MPLIEIHKLSVSFPQKGKEDFIAVNNISFSLEKGKVLAIVGESGSGKSLTALALMGLLPKEAAIKGNLIFNLHHQSYPLQSLTTSQWQELRRNHIGMIFQEPMSSLNPVMKIGKQLEETLCIHQNISKRKAKQQTLEWLQKVQLPSPGKTYHKYPHQLSGGQKQRMMIAMAMCNHPALLIADEPTTALDVTVQREIIDLMKSLQLQTGTSMIFITHDLALASMIADEVSVMYRGRQTEYGDATSVFTNPQQPYTKALIACKPNTDNKGKPLPTVQDFLEHKKENKLAYSASSVLSNVLLRVNDLDIYFPENSDWLGRTISFYKAVDKVSFELKQGEVLGLVGESGCGKSTLSKSIMGLLPVTAGSIFYKGKDITHLKADERRKLSTSVQMIFQDPYSSLNPRLTIGELLTEPMRVHKIVESKRLKTEALRLLDLVQLPADAFNRYPHQFSGGQRQRIGIARALSVKPELLICDESVSALDVSIQAQILNLLKQLQQELQLSYLFISHDLSVVHYISDRVLVMQTGEIIERGDATQVLLHPQNEYTKKLIEAMPEMKR